MATAAAVAALAVAVAAGEGAVSVAAASSAGAASSAASAAPGKHVVPPPASYGHGRFEFRVSFLAKPRHRFVRSRRPPGSSATAGDVVAKVQDQAAFSSPKGSGTELVGVIELAHRPRDTCQVMQTVLHTSPTVCPALHGHRLLHSVVRCPPTSCTGYSGDEIFLRGKMIYVVAIIGGDRHAVDAVLRSFSP